MDWTFTKLVFCYNWDSTWHKPVIPVYVRPQ